MPCCPRWCCHIICGSWDCGVGAVGCGLVGILNCGCGILGPDLDVGFGRVVVVGEETGYGAGGAAHAGQDADRGVGEIGLCVVQLGGLLERFQPVCCEGEMCGIV